MKLKTAKGICLSVILLAFLNFWAFMLITTWMGGSAGNGKIEDGHYFLGEHGHYSEVSQTLFQRMRLYEYAMFTTHGLGMLAGVLVFLVLPRFLQPAGTAGDERNVTEIERKKARRAMWRKVCRVFIALGIANFFFVAFFSTSFGVPPWYGKSIVITHPLTILCLAIDRYFLRDTPDVGG